MTEIITSKKSSLPKHLPQTANVSAVKQPWEYTDARIVSGINYHVRNVVAGCMIWPLTTASRDGMGHILRALTWHHLDL